MPQYRPSLAERKRQFLEDCAGCAGGGDMGGDVSVPEEPIDTGSDNILDKALGKLKKKRKKYGT